MKTSKTTLKIGNKRPIFTQFFTNYHTKTRTNSFFCNIKRPFNFLRKYSTKNEDYEEHLVFRRNFSINDVEKRIFVFLRECVDEIERNQKKGIVLRVTGSWVRYKIIDRLKEGEKIKIAVENIKVTEFCQLLFKFSKTFPNNANYKILNIRRSSNHSGGLLADMVKTSLYRTNVDLVNLISLSENKIGTAFENASGEDLTINSLYYNIMNDRVEDYTHLGMKDVKNKIIRTPLEARETLLMNSIRVMKIMRVASIQKDFVVDGELLDAFQLKEIHDDLKKQVNRERILDELRLLYEQSTTIQGIELMFESGLHTCIFYSPEVHWSNRSSHLSSSLVLNIANWMITRNEKFDEKFLTLFAASIAPLVLINRNNKIEFNQTSFYSLLSFMNVPSLMKKQLKTILESISLLLEILPVDLYESRSPSLQSIVRYWNEMIDKFANWFQNLFIPENKTFLWKSSVILTVELSNVLFNSHFSVPREDILESIDRMDIPYLNNYSPILDGNEISEIVGVKGETLGLICRYLFRWQMFKNTSSSKSDARHFVIELSEGMKKLNLIPPKDLIIINNNDNNNDDNDNINNILNDNNFDFNYNNSYNNNTYNNTYNNNNNNNNVRSEKKNEKVFKHRK